VLKGRISQ